MDRNRIRDAAMGRRGADVDRRMKRRLWVYGAAIVLIGAVFVWRDRPTVTPPRATEPLGPVDVPADRPPPRVRIDPELLAPVRDGTRAERALLERDAHVHLLEQASRLAWGDLEQMGVAPGDWDVLATEGAAHRGEPFWVLGTLKWIDTDMVDRMTRVRGEIEDADGRPWTFLVASEPWGVEVGQVVRVSGFFLKLYDMLRPPPWSDLVTAPLLVGDELLESAFRIEPVTRLRHDLFDDIQDADLAQANRPLESMAYYELLSYVTHAPLERLFPADRPPAEVQPIDLLRDFDHWRGQTVHVTGVLLYIKEAPLGPRGENPLGVPFVWQLWVSDTRSGDAGTMLVLALEKPEGVNEGDIVDVEGIYFRRYAFENKRNRPRMVAVIPARTVTRFVPRQDTLTPILIRVIVGLAGGVALLLIIGQWREKRSALTARGTRMARKRKIVADKMGERRGKDDKAQDPEADAPRPDPDDSDAAPDVPVPGPA